MRDVVKRTYVNCQYGDPGISSVYTCAIQSVAQTVRFPAPALKQPLITSYIGTDAVHVSAHV